MLSPAAEAPVGSDAADEDLSNLLSLVPDAQHVEHSAEGGPEESMSCDLPDMLDVLEGLDSEHCAADAPDVDGLSVLESLERDEQLLGAGADAQPQPEGLDAGDAAASRLGMMARMADDSRCGLRAGIHLQLEAMLCSDNFF